MPLTQEKLHTWIETFGEESLGGQEIPVNQSSSLKRGQDPQCHLIHLSGLKELHKKKQAPWLLCL